MKLGHPKPTDTLPSHSTIQVLKENIKYCSIHHKSRELRSPGRTIPAVTARESISKTEQHGLGLALNSHKSERKNAPLWASLAVNPGLGLSLGFSSLLGGTLQLFHFPACLQLCQSWLTSPKLRCFPLAGALSVLIKRSAHNWVTLKAFRVFSNFLRGWGNQEER